jgi:hypothetical protein
VVVPLVAAVALAFSCTLALALRALALQALLLRALTLECSLAFPHTFALKQRAGL